MRDSNFVVRLLPEEREQLDSQAERRGLTRSDLIRQMIRAGAFGGDDEGASVVKPLGGYTIVHDLDANESIMQINGVVVLPRGAIVELDDHGHAIVKRVRLLAEGEAGAGVHVCLDVHRQRATRRKR